MSARRKSSFRSRLGDAASDAAVAQLVERKLPNLERLTTRDQTRPVSCLRDRGPGGKVRLRSPRFAFVRHEAVRDLFGVAR